MISLSPRRIICVGYSDEHSINNKSILDLQLGHSHGCVSSNQVVLDRAEPGDLIVVTSQCRQFTIGRLDARLDNCALWASNGGHAWKYAWSYTPLTEIMPIANIREKWEAICDVHGVAKKPCNLFNSRLCGYGVCYVPALLDALTRGFIDRIA